MRLTALDAIEILDSRGSPTLRVSAHIKAEKMVGEGVFDVPSGKSTGEAEVMEKRDNESRRYGGFGVKKLAEKIRTEIFGELDEAEFDSACEFDKALLELDSTTDKSIVGGNAMLGISAAVSKAIAQANGLPLYKLIRAEFDQLLKPALRIKSSYSIPIPLLNLYNGGVHADNGISTQEFIVIPHGVSNFSDQLRAGASIYYNLKQILRFEKRTTGVGDEGGFSARWENDEDVLKLVVKAIGRAGYKPARQVSLGLDVAASEFYKSKDRAYTVQNWGRYGLAGDFKALSRHYWKWIARYPLMYFEDIFAEDDWVGFASFAQEMRERKVGFYLVGDDLTASRHSLLEKAIALGAINGIIIKPNQIGTVFETLETCALAKENDIEMFVSHRSGDTTDTFISDFAVGVGAKYIKSGAPCRGERVAKYNRLLEIEHELKK